MTTSAIYIQSDTSNGYAHIQAHIGNIDHDESAPRFNYIDASCNYGEGWSVSLRCQLGSGVDRPEDYTSKPYAIQFLIDPRASYGGLELNHVATLAKASAKIQRALAKVAAAIGEPESFEDHALALFLACKPELLVTRKGRDWTERDATTVATADNVRQAIRHELSSQISKLYPNKAEQA